MELATEQPLLIGRAETWLERPGGSAVAPFRVRVGGGRRAFGGRGGARRGRQAQCLHLALQLRHAHLVGQHLHRRGQVQGTELRIRRNVHRGMAQLQLVVAGKMDTTAVAGTGGHRLHLGGQAVQPPGNTAPQQPGNQHRHPHAHGEDEGHSHSHDDAKHAWKPHEHQHDAEALSDHDHTH